MRMLEPKEILRFAEGCSDFDENIEKEILAQVASSPDLRKRIAEMRRDLYLVECQIPEYQFQSEYILEVNKLAEIWVRLRGERKRKRESLRVGKNMVGVGLALIWLIGVALILAWYF